MTRTPIERYADLRDSGFSTFKKVVLMTPIIALWTFGLFLIVCFTALFLTHASELHYEPELSFGQKISYTVLSILIGGPFILVALCIQWYIRRCARKQRKRRDESSHTVREASYVESLRQSRDVVSYTRMPPWTSTKGTIFHPVLREGREHSFIFLVGLLPERLMDSTVAYASNVAGYIQWDPETGIMQGITTTRRFNGKNYQRQGIATYLYHEARKITPHLQHSDELTEDAKAWIRSMEGKV